jgi:hypothetical protein
LEADLLRHYGVDLLDYYRGRLSARRIRVLVEHLPRDSSLVRELYGDEGKWGLGEHLLAAAVDQLAAGNWMFASVHAPENAEPPERPKPIPRPGVDEDEPMTQGATTEQIAAFFGAPMARPQAPAATDDGRSPSGATS